MILHHVPYGPLGEDIVRRSFGARGPMCVKGFWTGPGVDWGAEVTAGCWPAGASPMCSVVIGRRRWWRVARCYRSMATWAVAGRHSTLLGSVGGAVVPPHHLEPRVSCGGPVGPACRLPLLSGAVSAKSLASRPRSRVGTECPRCSSSPGRHLQCGTVVEWVRA